LMVRKRPLTEQKKPQMTGKNGGLVQKKGGEGGEENCVPPGEDQLLATDGKGNPPEGEKGGFLQGGTSSQKYWVDTGNGAVEGGKEVPGKGKVRRGPHQPAGGPFPGRKAKGGKKGNASELPKKTFRRG